MGIDEEKVYEGSIKEDWDVLRQWIADLTDRRPQDWVLESTIDDPEDKKPDDWDDDEEILSDLKPESWNDEDDGEWDPPMVPNPAYKGAWSPKKITNPAYKGSWEFRKIPNPKYVDDDKVYAYADFGYLGLNIYQEKAGTIFDNIIVCDDEAEADEFAKMWRALNEVETAKK